MAIVSRYSSMNGLPFCNRSSLACINTTTTLRIGAHIHEATCVDRVVLHMLLYGSAVAKTGESVGEVKEREEKGRRVTYQGECTVVDQLIGPGRRPCVLRGQPRLDECRAIIAP